MQHMLLGKGFQQIRDRLLQSMARSGHVFHSPSCSQTEVLLRLELLVAEFDHRRPVHQTKLPRSWYFL